jgi:hypothetical protein
VPRDRAGASWGGEAKSGAEEQKLYIPSLAVPAPVKPAAAPPTDTIKANIEAKLEEQIASRVAAQTNVMRDKYEGEISALRGQIAGMEKRLASRRALRSS